VEASHDGVFILPSSTLYPPVRVTHIAALYGNPSHAA
jgi:hypothetical protein